MPGGFSTAKEKPIVTSPPPPLLGAAGGIEGNAGLDDFVDGLVMEPPRESPAPTPVAEGAHP